MLRKRQSVFSRGPRESPLLGNAQVPENGCLLRHDIGRRAAPSRLFLSVEGVGFELGGIVAANADGRRRHVNSKDLIERRFGRPGSEGRGRGCHRVLKRGVRVVLRSAFRDFGFGNLVTQTPVRSAGSRGRAAGCAVSRQSAAHEPYSLINLIAPMRLCR